MTLTAKKSIFAVILAILFVVPGTLFAQFSWNNVGGASATDGIVRAIAQDVSTGDVYVGGDFTSIVGVSASYIARWDGTNWNAVGTGTDGAVRAIVVSGGNVYAAGDFTNAGGSSANYVASWNGSTWSALGTGTDNGIDGLAESGGSVYAVGQFQNAGGSSANRIAVWNGAAWSTLGTGLNGRTKAIAIDGSDIYVAGFFTSAGGSGANRVAQWNGASWSALGTGVDASVNAVTVNGSNVYFGGSFTTAGGASANRLAFWDGASWSAMGSGVNSTVNALNIYLGEVYVGGFFTSSGGTSINRIAKWNGSGWDAVGTGTDSPVYALAVRGAEGAMYVGGDFTSAGGTTADDVARFTDTDNPLPISLSSFSAVGGIDQVAVSWTTESEHNNDAFIIERSIDGESFEQITEVDGQGTSNIRNEYTYVDRFVANGTTYYYRLSDRDFNGVITRHTTQVATPSSVGDALDQTNTVAVNFELHQNYPNPFNPETTIRFEVPSTTQNLKDVTLRIYNSLGQLISNLYAGPLSGGVYEMQWDGTNDNGQRQPSGIYFLQLQNGPTSQVQKMLLSR